MATVLEREEYIEQTYFFRILRERMASNISTQEVLEGIHQEILSITRLPLAIQFLATELKHTGLLSSGFTRLPHYFTSFQAFVIEQTEDEKNRFDLETALLILEREAQYRTDQPTAAGLFVYQFEALSRNRLGYDRGLETLLSDPFYDAAWREFLEMVRRQVGVVDFADLVYTRSEFYVMDQRRQEPSYQPSVLPLFSEKEGKIARAHRGKDPLFLFAALQRQLGYPEVPRPRPRDDLAARVEFLRTQVKNLELRLRLMESELKGQVDWNQLLKNTDLMKETDEGK